MMVWKQKSKEHWVYVQYRWR